MMHSMFENKCVHMHACIHIYATKLIYIRYMRLKSTFHQSNRYNHAADYQANERSKLPIHK
jgi:hypothetical protein